MAGWTRPPARACRPSGSVPRPGRPQGHRRQGQLCGLWVQAPCQELAVRAADSLESDFGVFGGTVPTERATCGPTSSRSPAPTGRTGRWPSAPMSWPAGSGCGRPPRSSAAPANPAAVSQRKSTVQLARLAAGGPPRRSLTRCSPSSTRQRAPARGHTGTPAVRPPHAEEPETLGFGAGGRHEPRKPFPTAQRAPSRRAAPRRTRPPAARRAASRPARRQAERTERQTQARASRAERSSRPTIPTATNAEHPRLLAGPSVPCRACLRDLMLGLRSRRSAILPAES